MSQPIDAKPAVDVARLLLGASTLVADNFIKNGMAKVGYSYINIGTSDRLRQRL